MISPGGRVLRGGVRVTTPRWAGGPAGLRRGSQAWPEGERGKLVSFTMLVLQNKKPWADADRMFLLLLSSPSCSVVGQAISPAMLSEHPPRSSSLKLRLVSVCTFPAPAARHSCQALCVPCSSTTGSTLGLGHGSHRPHRAPHLTPHPVSPQDSSGW